MAPPKAPHWIYQERIAALQSQLVAGQSSSGPPSAPLEDFAHVTSFKPHQPIDRKRLYEEVWTTPFTKLAPQYGYSDAGLRKVCLALEIPIPAAGHWARVEAGQVVGRPPLLEQEQRVVRYHKDPRLIAANNADTRAADLEWLAKMESSERELVAAPKVELAAPAVIGRLEAALDRARKKAPKRLAELIAADGKRKKPNRWEPDYATFEWSSAASVAHVLMDHDAHSLRVSDTGADSALQVLREFACEAIRRGATISDTPKGPNVQLEMVDQKCCVTVKERFAEAKIKRTLTGAEYATRVGTGELVLIIDGIGVSQKEFTGDLAALLEMIRGGDVFLALYRRVMYCRQQARVEAVRQETWQEERREADRRRAIARSAEEARKAEEKRRADLAEAAALWGRVVQIRAYVAAVRAAARETPSQDLQDWLLWADQVIDEVDPVSARVAGAGAFAEGQGAAD